MFLSTRCRLFERLIRTEIKFDLDDDGMINMDEFVKGFTRWIDETKDAMDIFQHVENTAVDLCTQKMGNQIFLQLKNRIIKQFDVSGDEMISVEEFVTGFSQCLHDKNWELMEKLMQKETERSAIAWIKAKLFLVIGIEILGLLAEPLIKSVGSFSRAIRFPVYCRHS
ncbi:hypothetical protein H5410_049645 [Solanum commersonii]|uniref:EF-hand domain-containing protein n=1 Tax=Solanum commersonii TaxID=4109 RepID=A0A9J5WTG2_SOLCO|nr:hypothetical protein H5410_049645 [Solanum commersonii]